MSYTELGKLAIVANVGTLVRPLTKAEYSHPAFRKPYQLFSHSDQVNSGTRRASRTHRRLPDGAAVSDRLTAGK